jgi:putative DNA primase/helicase
MSKSALKGRLAKASATMSHALKSESASRIAAMIELAKSEPGIPILPEDLDRDPWLLNCPNGTLELRTGTLREHRRKDYITKLCPTECDPQAEAPRFRQFLDDVFRSDVQLIAYLQRLFGYCLTGDVCEQILAIFWGVGANGKSTLINAVMSTLGEDYAIKANRDLFMAKKQDGHPTQMARLFGKRLVVCVETHEGARLDEGLIKELTGGDRIAARRMREDWWEFDPTHKAILVTNHKPEVRGTDHAIWRRPRLIPFAVIFPDDRQDKQLGEKLKAETKGILRWMVDGCMDWQRTGLETPEVVLAATKEYRTEQDRLAAFLADSCLVGPDYRAKVGELYAAYKAWCERNGEQQGTGMAFGLGMGERGFVKDPGKRWYLGLALQHGENQDGI